MNEKESQEFHTRPVYDEAGNEIGSELILDEGGEPIPKTICICCAYEPNECVCGAWADVDSAAWYANDEIQRDDDEGYEEC